MSVFETREPNIENNQYLRIPQIEAYQEIKAYYNSDLDSGSRETAIILPVGCGKSGLITLTPFAVKSKRTLVIAPGLNIASQLFSCS